MKKILSVLLVLALCAAMLTVFTGCGNEADKVLGTWRGEVDMTGIINDELAADPTLAGYFNISDFRVTMVMTFNEDGTYYSTIDADSVQAAMEGMIADMADGIYAMFEDELAASGLDMSVEELLEMSGMTMDDVMYEMTAAMDTGVIDMVVAEATLEGNYEVKGDKLFLSDGLDYAVDPSVYEVISVDGSTLTLKESVGGEADTFGVYPVVFTKE